MSRVIHKATTEELLSSLENDDIVESVEADGFEDEILKFISQYKIERGENKVSPRVLFKLFQKFSKTEKSQSYLTFSLSKHVEFKSGWFFINRSSLDISDALFKELSKTKRKALSSVKKQNHFESFMKDSGIVSGGFFLPWYVFYYMYQEWRVKTRKSIGMQRSVFCNFLALHLIEKRISKDILRWYGVNSIEIRKYLTDDKYKEIKSWYKSQKKAKSKATYQVPSVGPEAQHSESSESN